jgi:putative oxidoreductase
VITAAAFFSLVSSMVCGFLLIIGLFEYPALYVLTINLIVAVIGFGIINPVWDMRLVFPRMALLIFLLLVPPHSQILSLDYLLFNL